MKVNRAVGAKYRPIVTVLKLKSGLPSVVDISGNKYILRNDKDDRKGDSIDE